MTLIVALSLAIVPPALFRDAPDYAGSTGALLTQSVTASVMPLYLLFLVYLI